MSMGIDETGQDQRVAIIHHLVGRHFGRIASGQDFAILDQHAALGGMVCRVRRRALERIAVEREELPFEERLGHLISPVADTFFYASRGRG